MKIHQSIKLGIAFFGVIIALSGLAHLEQRVNRLEHATVTIPNVVQMKTGYPTYGNGQGAGDVEIHYPITTNIIVGLDLHTNL